MDPILAKELMADYFLGITESINNDILRTVENSDDEIQKNKKVSYDKYEKLNNGEYYIKKEDDKKTIIKSNIPDFLNEINKNQTKGIGLLKYNFDNSLAEFIDILHNLLKFNSLATNDPSNLDKYEA